MSWLSSPAHARWLEAEGDRLLEFGRASRHPAGGFAWLDAAGEPELARPVERWSTGRRAHVYSLAHRMGRPWTGCGTCRRGRHGKTLGANGAARR